MVKPSIYQCCLDNSFSGSSTCSGTFKINFDSDSNNPLYQYTKCNNIFNNYNKLGEDGNYGWDYHIDNYKSEYQTIFLSDTYSDDTNSDDTNSDYTNSDDTNIFSDSYTPLIVSTELFTNNNNYYAYHSTNEQASNNQNSKKNINNKTIDLGELYGSYDSNGITNASIIQSFSHILANTNMNFCNQKPFKYSDDEDLVLCNTKTDRKLDLKNSSESIANGSDICEYTYNSGKLTNTPETQENCENKYFEYSIDTPYDLGIDSDTNLPYYPSFTKNVKCRWNGSKCTMSKGSKNSASLVNECLIDNNCTKENFMNGKCSQHDFIDSYLANKGYNKEYSNICSCKYDESYYEATTEDEDTINGVLYQKMCKNLGFEENSQSGIDYNKCIESAKKAYENSYIEADNGNKCKNSNYPCINAVINDDCSKSKQPENNFIQICSNVINSDSPSNVDADQNIACTQAINDGCGDDADNCIKLSPEKGKDHSSLIYKCSGAPDYKCSQVEPGKGDYDTLEQCNSNCNNSSPPNPSLIYKCSGAPDYKCSKVDSGKGDYDTLENCSSNCVNPSPPSASLIYKCSGAPDYNCSQVEPGKGDYDTNEHCIAGCKRFSTSQIVIIVIGVIFGILLLFGFLIKGKIISKITKHSSLTTSDST